MQSTQTEVSDASRAEDLTITHIIQYLPTAYQFARVCSIGSKGYCAVKEMLQNGIPGTLHLIESRDLREVVNCGGGGGWVVECCLLYTPVYVVPYRSSTHPLYEGYRELSYHDYAGHIPPTATNVTLYSNMCTTPYLLLSGVSTIASIDLRPISPFTSLSQQGVIITTILDGFLEDCIGLLSVDLTPLSQVTRIQSDFLSGCSGLTSIDLTPLSNVEEISDGFLAFCSGLSVVDMSPMTSYADDIESVSILEGCCPDAMVTYPPPLCRSSSTSGANEDNVR